MSSRNKKEADKIIRESLRGNNTQIYPRPQQFKPFGPMPPMNLPFPMGPFQPPQLPAAPQQPMRGVNGPCFTCQQHGHVARNCPNAQSNFRGGGNSRQGGRGYSNKKKINKKKN